MKIVTTNISKLINMVTNLFIIGSMLIIAIFLINKFLLVSYKIPSESMLPGIKKGDRIFVNKLGYGGKVNFFGKEISTPKFKKINRGDVVVFHFPEGDTVNVTNPVDNYYQKIRKAIVRKEKIKDVEKAYLPISYRVPYVKRCVGVSGDSLKIINGEIFVNGKKQIIKSEIKRNYRLYTKFPDEVRKKLSSIDGSIFVKRKVSYVVSLTYKERNEVLDWVKEGIIDSIKPLIHSWNTPNTYPFLGDHPAPYTWDNYGPVYIPQKGDTLSLAGDNFYRYKRIIEVYEANTLSVRSDSIFINDKYAERYVCKQNYYFMMGDNRHNSIDSRNWGLVPEDHLIGEVMGVAWSISSDESVRWDRLAKIIK